MKSNFSNLNLHKSYSAVRIQQGRVQTDSDFNEQNEISKQLQKFAPFQYDSFEPAPKRNLLTAMLFPGHRFDKD
jgi:hypothetical protein